MNKKRCIVCSVDKEETEFFIRSDSGKRRNTCKVCQAKQAKANRLRKKI